MRIAILDDYLGVALDSAPWNALPDADVTVFDRHLGDENAVAEALADFELLVAMRERTPFPASLIERLPKLRLLVTSGMRNLSIDMAAARARGIDVCGTQMAAYGPAFEHAWALIMALFKNIPREDRSMHEGGWQAGIAQGIFGKTLGIIGLGKLGAKTARIGLAFGMEVMAWSENLTAERAAEVGVERVALDALLKRSDVISLHTVLSPRTRGLIGKRELDLMQPSAYLVNTSRGPIVDEAALIEALENGTIAGAGIDVFDVEPLPGNHALRRLDNAVLTGHTGYVVKDTFDLAYTQAIENIEAWRAGRPIRLLNAESRA